MKDYLNFWCRYLDFKGRSTVYEFCNAWLWFVLTNIIIVILSAVIFISCFRLDAETASAWAEFFTSVFCLFSLSPLLAITVRRLRDAGYSPKTFLWLLVPGIGMIAFAVRLFSKSAVYAKKTKL